MRLNNWSLWDKWHRFSFSDSVFTRIIEGELEDGTPISLSLTNLDTRDGKAITRSGTYELGNPDPEYTDWTTRHAGG